MNIPVKFIETLKNLLSSADIDEKQKELWLNELNSPNPKPETLYDIAQYLDGLKKSDDTLKGELHRTNKYFHKQEEAIKEHESRLSDDIDALKQDSSKLAREVKELSQEYEAKEEPHEPVKQTPNREPHITDEKPIETSIPQQNSNQPPISLPSNQENSESQPPEKQKPEDGYY